MTRLLIYDASEESAVGKAWKAGAFLNKKYFDEIWPVYSWSDFNNKVTSSTKKFDEIHWWGHGSPGRLYINEVKSNDKYLASFNQVVHQGGFIWLRVCAFAQGETGMNYMEWLSSITNTIVFAHTYNIGHWGAHSGLVKASPGQLVKYSETEGRDPKTNKLLNSSWVAPRTISALRMKIPIEKGLAI